MILWFSRSSGVKSKCFYMCIPKADTYMLTSDTEDVTVSVSTPRKYSPVSCVARTGFCNNYECTISCQKY